MMSLVKVKLIKLISFLNDKARSIVFFFLILLRPFPRLLVSVAHLCGSSATITMKLWHIQDGPLKGFKLKNLLPLEIGPVLKNEMEIHCSNLLNRLNLDCATVIDAGGSYGYYALLLSRLVGIGKVFSFEPDWRSYGRLTTNISINNICNIIPVPVCLTNSPPTIRKWHSRQSDPWDSCLAADDCDPANLTAVPVVSIDLFCQLLDIISDVKLLKIDVEGAELDVLKGAENLLQSSKPVILCELHSEIIAQRVFYFLSSQNYRWRMVEYMNKERQHIFAFPQEREAFYCKLIS
jgi:FkbM family methyltransferase